MNTEALAELAERYIQKDQGNLKDFRQTHLNLFKKTGIQSKSEDYKFTNLNAFLEKLEDSGQVKQFTNENFEDDRFINFIFTDGKLQNPKHLPEGITFSTSEKSPEAFFPLLKVTHPLSHLHHALISNAVMIEIKKNVKIDRPLRLIHFTSSSKVQAPTTIIKLGAFSELSMIEEVLDQNIGYALAPETYINLSTGSRLEHLQLNHCGQGAIIHSSTFAKVDKDAVYRNLIINTSGKMIRNNLQLDLVSPGAHGESYNLYLTNGKEHSDINTVIHHRAADTTSDQMAKGILDQESKGIFTGKIHIHPHSQRVSAGQVNRNLLLSNKAQCHSQPQLEIFADDVKCSHGSTTGQLSDDELFYFESRGIPAEKARSLLAYGFALEIVQKIQHPALKALVSSVVKDSMKEKFKLGGES